MSTTLSAVSVPVHGVCRSASPLLAEGNYSPYDQGIRHIATLAGYLSYGLMAWTVIFGILTTTGWARRSVKRQTLHGGHMMLAVMTLTFGVLHGVAYAFQVDDHFGFLKVVVPFVQDGEPEVALGIVGLELGVAVAVSIWFQRKLGYRRWHLLHFGAYGAFGLSLAHTIATSPEVRSLGGLAIVVGAAAGAVALLLLLRLLPATAALPGLATVEA